MISSLDPMPRFYKRKNLKNPVQEHIELDESGRVIKWVYKVASKDSFTLEQFHSMFN